MFSFLLLSLLFFLQTTLSSANTIEQSVDQAEQELSSIIELIRQQKVNLALLKSENLLNKYPQFKAAKLVYTDLLLSKQDQLNQLFSIENSLSKRNELVSEVNIRVKSDSNRKQQIPDLVKYLSPSLKSFVVVDLSQSRLYLFVYHNNKFQLVSDHYVTIGKNGFNKQKRGDKRTPIGIYKITRFMPDNQLPELYGWGAFPINYPNAWDRSLKRTGSGIWLHGVPRTTYSRPPLASKGCIALSNELLSQLSPYLKTNTLVLLSDQLIWQDLQLQQEKQLSYVKLFFSWLKSWKNKITPNYLDFYSKNLHQHNKKLKNYHQWRQHKKSIFRMTKNIQLKIKDLSIIQYPAEENILSINFYQDYQGDSYHSKGMKQQYWKLEDDGKWRIIYEQVE